MQMRSRQRTPADLNRQGKSWPLWGPPAFPSPRFHVGVSTCSADGADWVAHAGLMPSRTAHPVGHPGTHQTAQAEGQSSALTCEQRGRPGSGATDVCACNRQATSGSGSPGSPAAKRALDSDAS